MIGLVWDMYVYLCVYYMYNIYKYISMMYAYIYIHMSPLQMIFAEKKNIS